MAINLIVQYYKCPNEARQEEIDICLTKNLNNEFISSVHLLTEELYDLSKFPHAEKIRQTVISERLTYEHAFLHANKHHENQIWLLSNADIYFDESLRHLNDVKLDDTVFALTRYDIQEDGTPLLVDPFLAHACQDTWIFKTPIETDKLFAKFCLGIPGCDNRIAYELVNAGYRVLNSSLKIKTYHLDLARRAGLFERNREYGKLMTEENFKQGLAVPPPYQYYLYPVDQLEPNSQELFKLQLSKLAELDAYKKQYHGLLQTWSWKITGPLRIIKGWLK